ncbi:hypothetical protein C8F01DRAFT_377162 [Mycena amicta]|nr:hypothetical protein C8F01DRAFT_377162 [Mycena amicta]
MPPTEIHAAAARKSTVPPEEDEIILYPRRRVGTPSLTVHLAPSEEEEEVIVYPRLRDTGSPTISLDETIHEVELEMHHRKMPRMKEIVEPETSSAELPKPEYPLHPMARHSPIPVHVPDEILVAQVGWSLSPDYPDITLIQMQEVFGDNTNLFSSSGPRDARAGVAPNLKVSQTQTVSGNRGTENVAVRSNPAQRPHQKEKRLFSGRGRNLKQTSRSRNVSMPAGGNRAPAAKKLEGVSRPASALGIIAPSPLWASLRASVANSGHPRAGLKPSEVCMLSMQPKQQETLVSILSGQRVNHMRQVRAYIRRRMSMSESESPTF